jgi:bifunctional DNase/RNase
MIKLQLERFDDARRILVLKEVEGSRHLFIGVGENEAKEFRRVMGFHPRSLSASRAEWMDMIERRGAQLEAVAITNLVDGVFKACVYLSQEDRRFTLPARPADALEWSMRKLIPIWATEEIMRVASVTMRFETAEQVLAGTGPKPNSAEFDVPVATFEDPSRGWMKRNGMWFVRAMTVTYGVFCTLVVLLTLRYIGRHLLNGDLLEVRRDITWFLPVYLTLALGFFLLYGLHSSYRPGRVKLQIFPFGVGVWVGKIKGTMLWASLDGAGKTDWFVPTIDGLKSKDRLLGIGGLGLSPYDQNWREGEIGHNIRRYAPRLLGIEPVDPEGGSAIF